MGPGGSWGFCLALLCSGAALDVQEEEPSNRNVTEKVPEGTRGPLEPPGHPTAATGDGVTATVTMRPGDTTRPPGSGDLVVTAAENRTRTSSGVPARYWSPVLFVVLALLVLLVTYHRTKGKGIQDLAASGSDSSDLGALVQPPIHDLIPKFPQREREDPETSPRPDLSETPLGPPEPSQSPPDSPLGDS